MFENHVFVILCNSHEVFLCINFKYVFIKTNLSLPCSQIFVSTCVILRWFKLYERAYVKSVPFYTRDYKHCGIFSCFLNRVPRDAEGITGYSQWAFWWQYNWVFPTDILNSIDDFFKANFQGIGWSAYHHFIKEIEKFSLEIVNVLRWETRCFLFHTKSLCLNHFQINQQCIMHCYFCVQCFTDFSSLEFFWW